MVAWCWNSLPLPNQSTSRQWPFLKVKRRNWVAPRRGFRICKVWGGFFRRGFPHLLSDGRILRSWCDRSSCWTELVKIWKSRGWLLSSLSTLLVLPFAYIYSGNPLCLNPRFKTQVPETKTPSFAPLHVHRIYICVHKGWILFLHLRLFFFLMNNKAMNFKGVVCSTEGLPSGSKAKSSKGYTTQRGNTTHRETNVETNPSPSLDKGKKIADEALEVELGKVEALAEIRKGNTIMGCIIGEPIRIDLIREKLQGDWRLIHGEVQIYEHSHGWFECVFSNPFDKSRVWQGRPYHVLGQIVLLKPWTVEFHPETENTSILDLWIRIFRVPSVLVCNQGLKLIVERNGVGNYIKYDHASGGYFARVCVNIDMSKGIMGDVKLSEKIDDMKTFDIWFEDFPQGCGNCGDLNHSYVNCPDRKIVPKTIKVEIIKRSKLKPQSEIPEPVIEEEEGWVKPKTRRSRSRNKESTTPHGIKPYVARDCGVSVSFISTFKEVEVNDPMEENQGENNKEDQVKEAELTNQQEETEERKEDEHEQNETKKSGENSAEEKHGAKEGNQEDEGEKSSSVNKSIPPSTNYEDDAFSEDELEALMEEDDLLGEDLEEMMEEEINLDDDAVFGGNVKLMLSIPSMDVQVPTPPSCALNNLAIISPSHLILVPLRGRILGKQRTLLPLSIRGRKRWVNG